MLLTSYVTNRKKGSTRRDGDYEMTKAIIQCGETFKILNLSSMCAYGSFDSREEAEEALVQAAQADQLARCGQ